MLDMYKAADIGKLIKQARKTKGLTQTELGNRLGLKKAAISKYEKGQILNIPLEMRLKLADVLKLPGYLFCSDNELNLIERLFESEQQYEI